uniref:Uncharacterized protein n=1 Tax=Tanacetum cinerariifolium TaxID=118510 RepID=A0A699IQ82_TANCI|nr:hypothetical protein [Tanacetum cinerariifolium]
MRFLPVKQVEWVTLGRLLPHARGLGFKPRCGGFPSRAKKEWGLSPKAKVRVLHTAQLDVTIGISPMIGFGKILSSLITIAVRSEFSNFRTRVDSSSVDPRLVIFEIGFGPIFSPRITIAVT